MLSSDKNVESIAQLVESVKSYVELQGEYLKLDVIQKIVRLATALTLTIVFLLLGISFLFYLSFAIVYWLVPVTGTPLAFLIVALFFLALLVVVFINRKAWIERPLVRFLADVEQKASGHVLNLEYLVSYHCDACEYQRHRADILNSLGCVHRTLTCVLQQLRPKWQR